MKLFHEEVWVKGTDGVATGSEKMGVQLLCESGNMKSAALPQSRFPEKS